MSHSCHVEWMVVMEEIPIWLRSDHNTSLASSKCGMAAQITFWSQFVLPAFTPGINMFFVIQITCPDTDCILMSSVSKLGTKFWSCCCQREGSCPWYQLLPVPTLMLTTSRKLQTVSHPYSWFQQFEGYTVLISPGCWGLSKAPFSNLI